MNRPFVRTLGLIGLWLALVGASFQMGSGSVLALNNCVTSPCKKVLGWWVWGDEYAQGMQSQGDNHAPILYGMSGRSWYVSGATEGDTPQVVLGTQVDRYSYLYSLTCNIVGGGAGDVQEATISVPAVDVLATNLAHSTCVAGAQ